MTSAALQGMRVLDMTQYEAGTSCTQFLAWLGAEIVKVEGPQGDPGRRVYGERMIDSQYFMNYNANKRSITLDLRTSRGHELFLEMAKHYDVFVENYGPDTVNKLGISYDDLRAVNEKIIYARIKGFGVTGPMAHYLSFDSLAQAAGGTFSVTGELNSPPLRPGPTFADTGTGSFAALAIVAAYNQLQRTGVGQHIEVSMQEATLNFMKTASLYGGEGAWGGGEAVQRRGSAAGPPSGLYPCKGGGPNDYAYLLVGTSQMWDMLCAVIGRPDLLMDERFADWQLRATNGDQLAEEISIWTREHTKFEVMELLQSVGVPAAAIYDTIDIFQDVHLHERGFIQTVDHPAAGPVTLFGPPFRLSESSVPLAPSPTIGQHTDEVLAADLNLSSEELQRLREEGVTGWRLATENPRPGSPLSTMSR